MCKLVCSIKTLSFVLMVMCLSACASETSVKPVATGTLPPASTAQAAPTQEIPHMPTLTATADLHQEWLDWLAARPRDMESYGLMYDPEALASLPPSQSINMPIWGSRLPLRVIDSIPEFIDTTDIFAQGGAEEALREVDCDMSGEFVSCAPESPLQQFGCEEFASPVASGMGLPDGTRVLARCLNSADDQADRDSYLYRVGCAFRMDVAYILEDAQGYRLIQTPLELKQLWQPIETAEEALVYAVLATGLSATYHFEAQPDLLYFKDPLEGTNVDEQDGEYRVNLFHFQTCLCEPWINSEVFLSVNRQGEITWLNALPTSMTIGVSCAD